MSTWNEVKPCHKMEKALLVNGFPVRKGGSYRRSRLGYIIVFTSHRFGDNTTVMFMTPDDKVNAVIKHAFRHRFLGPTLYSVWRFVRTTTCDGSTLTCFDGEEEY